MHKWSLIVLNRMLSNGNLRNKFFTFFPFEIKQMGAIMHKTFSFSLDLLSNWNGVNTILLFPSWKKNVLVYTGKTTNDCRWLRQNEHNTAIWRALSWQLNWTELNWTWTWTWTWMWTVFIVRIGRSYLKERMYVMRRKKVFIEAESTFVFCWFCVPSSNINPKW